MLYYLSLLTHMDQFEFFRLFRYLTFRAGGAVITAILFSFIVNSSLIQWLKVKQGKGQPIRADGPQRHIVEKAGTPTMGGVLILLPWIVSTLLWANIGNKYIWIVVFVTVAYGALGFADDYMKVSKRSSDGVSGRLRLVVEFLVAFAADVGLHAARYHADRRHAEHPVLQVLRDPVRHGLHRSWRHRDHRIRQRGELHRRPRRPRHCAGNDRGRDVPADRLPRRQLRVRALP